MLLLVLIVFLEHVQSFRPLKTEIVRFPIGFRFDLLDKSLIRETAKKRELQRKSSAVNQKSLLRYDTSIQIPLSRLIHFFCRDTHWGE